MSDKRKVGWYLNETDLARLQRVALERNSTEAELAGIAISRFLRECSELTEAERNRYKLDQAERKIDGILAEIRAGTLYSLPKKLAMLYNYLAMFSGKAGNESRYGEFERSFFEAVVDVRDIDKPLYKSILIDMGRIGNMRKRFLGMYPEHGQKTLEP